VPNAIQIAILSRNQAQVTLPPSLIADPKPFSTVFVLYNRIDDFPFTPMGTGAVHTVYVNNDCKNAAFVLDGAVYIGGTYAGCNFFSDGGDFYRDQTVRVIGGKLIMGPHVTRDSYFFEKAHKLMPELTPVPYTELPNAESIRKQAWPGD
jgi:hypothetical protein